MRLRRKILSATVAVMALVFVILSVWLFAEKWSARLDAERYRRSFEAAIGAVARSLDLGEHPERLSELREAIGRDGAIEEWIMVDEAGRVVAWVPRKPAATHLDPQMVRRAGYDITVPLVFSARKRWRLYARSSGVGGTLIGGMGEMLLVVTLGTVFLVTVLYGLMDRLVLRPLGDVVAAAQEIERGGVPAKVPGEERFDEVGTLLRSFNRMAQEVYESRRKLEARVEEALEQYRRAQRQLTVAQRLSATGQLAAGIAHEINNPLGGMVNAARSIRRSVADGTREAEYADLVLDGLDRVARTTKGMLQFSRAPEPGAVAPVSVAEIVTGARGFCLHRLGQEGVELDIDIPESLPMVTGELHELQQVVLNLLVNSIDAVAGSEVKRVTVSARADGDAVEMAVTDTGPGMDEKTREQAFDIFFTTKEPEAGTGLGLSVVHQIVSDHGGEADIESSPGGGTTVRIRLPAAGAPEGDRAEEARGDDL